MAQDGLSFEAGIDTSAEAIDTLACGERGEPVRFLAMLRVDPRNSQCPPAKRDHGLPLAKEDKDAEPLSRFAWKSRLCPQPDHSVALAHRLVAIDPDKRIGLLRRTFRSSSTRCFDQPAPYDISSADA